MTSNTATSLKARLKNLESHLATENPALKDAVKSFRKLDAVAYRLGMMGRDQSFATQVTWWPVISILGTFSSGKSTFINQYVGQKLQATGNQAVDDKFTVICYGSEDESRVLPGRALDNEPRFPFYRISESIDELLAGEGRRLDVYLQLRTCNSDRLRGRILIDSPGFDADDQRTATLRISEHILDLSDLVLVFFDARHPEPGAMRDTLDHLVRRTLERPDFNKFLYVLNQIDSAAREDNPEEVFSAWQRALAQKGLTAGRFFRIYDPDAAGDFGDEALRERFERKRNADMDAIIQRMEQVNVERAYRVSAMLEETAHYIGDTLVPAVTGARRAWKRRITWLQGIIGGGLLGVVIAIGVALHRSSEDGLSLGFPENPIVFWGGLALILILGWAIQHWIRRVAGRQVARRLEREQALGRRTPWLLAAFEHNVRSLKPYFFTTPRGYGRRVRRRLAGVISDAHGLVQALNDRFTRPSGPGGKGGN